MTKLFLLPFFAYLIGSVPFGLILTRIFTSEDITQKGSGNIGATNVKRVAGTPLGILTLIGDVLKGALPVYLAMKIVVPESDYLIFPGIEGLNIWKELYISVIAFSAFMGHLYPIFMKFRNGGKGVATAGGCFLVISPVSFFIAILVFIMFICWFNSVSPASLASFGVLPVILWESAHSPIITGCSVIIAIFIFIRHKENIRRIWSGTEPKVF